MEDSLFPKPVDPNLAAIATSGARVNGVAVTTVSTSASTSVRNHTKSSPEVVECHTSSGASAHIVLVVPLTGVS